LNAGIVLARFGLSIWKLRPLRRGTKRGTCTLHKGEAKMIAVCIYIYIYISKCKKHRDGKNNFGVIYGHIEITC